jgi:hypothetical protein
MRAIGDGNPTNAVSDGTPFLEVDAHFGDPFAEGDRSPFDYMTISARVEDMTSVGLIQIQGHLATIDLQRSETARHIFVITQNFDFLSHELFKFGGHSVGAAVLSDWRLSDQWGLDTHVELDGYVLNAVDSEFAYLAELVEVNRLREYDFGMGAGVRLGVRVTHSGREIVGARYLGSWVNTLNGSNAGGYASDHLVHLARASTAVPISPSWALGFDLALQASRSYYAAPERPNSSRMLPLARISLIRNLN